MADFYKDANGKRYKILENNLLSDGKNYFIIDPNTKVPIQVTATVSKFQPSGQVSTSEEVRVFHGDTSVLGSTGKSAYVTPQKVNTVSK